MEWKQGEYVVSDDPGLLQPEEIHSFLAESYWAKGRSLDAVKASIQNSICFGLYSRGRQIGFARAITDQQTAAFLVDVYVLEEFRRQRLGHFLMECVFSHPNLQSVKWILKSTYARSLYADFGFKDFDTATGWMYRRPQFISG